MTRLSTVKTTGSIVPLRRTPQNDAQQAIQRLDALKMSTVAELLVAAHSVIESVNALQQLAAATRILSRSELDNHRVLIESLLRTCTDAYSRLSVIAIEARRQLFSDPWIQMVMQRGLEAIAESAVVDVDGLLCAVSTAASNIGSIQTPIVNVLAQLRPETWEACRAEIDAIAVLVSSWSVQMANLIRLQSRNDLPITQQTTAVTQ